MADQYCNLILYMNCEPAWQGRVTKHFETALVLLANFGQVRSHRQICSKLHLLERLPGFLAMSQQRGTGSKKRAHLAARGPKHVWSLFSRIYEAPPMNAPTSPIYDGELVFRLYSLRAKFNKPKPRGIGLRRSQAIWILSSNKKRGRNRGCRPDAKPYG